MRSYTDMIERRKREYGAKFDDSDLVAKFRPFYETQARIKIRTYYGEEITGTIGVTTGWRPAFILMRRSNSLGSSDILDGRSEVIAIQRGRVYEPFTER